MGGVPNISDIFEKILPTVERCEMAMGFFFLHQPFLYQLFISGA